MPTLRQLAVSLAIAVLCMLLGAAIYESVVMAPNYVHSLAALEHARGFREVSTPAAYFRILSPVGQLLLAASVVLSWRAPARKARWLLLSALVAAVATDVVTFTFHYPRNEILFVASLDRPWVKLQRIAQEWAWGNYLRIVLLVIAVSAAFGANWKLGGSSPHS